MTEYPKIESIFVRDEKTHKLNPGQWRLQEFDYLKDCPWVCTEKVDGTNIRVMWDGERVTFGGRTDKAQLYVPLLNRLTEMFPAEKMMKVFGPPAEDGPTSICLYGEGYGKGIQKGGVYRDTPDLILFDIRVGPWWLKREDVRSLASELEIQQVPVRNVGPLPEAVDLVREGLISCWGNFPAEGLVCRPAVDLLMRNGQRVITKVKGCDF